MRPRIRTINPEMLSDEHVDRSLMGLPPIDLCTICGEVFDTFEEEVVCTRCALYAGDDDPEVGVAHLAEHPYWCNYYLSAPRAPDRYRIYSDLERPGWYAWHWARGRNPFDPGRVKKRIPEPLRLAVIARDGLTCQLCGLTVDRADVHIDHRKPESAGGHTTLENLQVTHSFCNMSKGARLLIEEPA